MPPPPPAAPRCLDGVTTYRKGRDRGFQSMLSRVFTQRVFQAECVRKVDGRYDGVAWEYARQNAMATATVLCVVDTETRRRGKGAQRTCGFGVGHVDSTRSRLIVDVVCSSQRQGGRILRALEAHARDEALRVVALRAATDALIPIYERHGYERRVNACAPRRHERRGLGGLDSALHGYWMTKCLPPPAPPPTPRKAQRAAVESEPPPPKRARAAPAFLADLRDVYVPLRRSPRAGRPATTRTAAARRA